MTPITIAIAVISLIAGFFVRPLILKPKPCPTHPPCPPAPTGPDNIDAYRILAQLRDAGTPSVSILTEDYATTFPAEFVTKKVVANVAFAGYIYTIEPR